MFISTVCLHNALSLQNVSSLQSVTLLQNASSLKSTDELHNWSWLTSPVSSPRCYLKNDFSFIPHPPPWAEDPSSRDQECPQHTSSLSLELSPETLNQSGYIQCFCCSWAQPASVLSPCKRRILPLPIVSKQAVRCWIFLASLRTLKRNMSEVGLLISVISCRDLPRHVGTASAVLPGLDMISVSG